jgi:hypothetical protein
MFALLRDSGGSLEDKKPGKIDPNIHPTEMMQPDNREDEGG